MIIDAHAHVGSCRVFNTAQTANQLLEAMEGSEVDAAIVQPFPGAPDPAEAHDVIASMAEDHPGRVFGMASLNPHQDKASYREEIRRCVEELGFVAVKLHPLGHAVMPGSDDARLVLETAGELDVPVMIHTGPGFPFADPSAWIPAARELPDLRIILGHAGAAMFSHAAIVAAQLCDNITLETSWCRPQDIKRAVKTLGAERVLFGSDMIFNIPVELAKYQAAGLTDPERKAVFEDTARWVFRLGESA